MPPTFSFFPDGLDPELELNFKPLCLELSAEQVVELADRVQAHLEVLRQAERVNKALDKATAEAVAHRLTGLLAEITCLPKDQRPLVIGAARYFIRSLDIQPDFNSSVGFIDDVTVLNFVLRQIGRDDLRLDKGG
jgi:uncharacterized membrane protein YkvA (DUF1232 family)